MEDAQVTLEAFEKLGAAMRAWAKVMVDAWTEIMREGIETMKEVAEAYDVNWHDGTYRGHAPKRVHHWAHIVTTRHWHWDPRYGRS